MTTFKTTERYVSQVPAVMALMQFGYKYLPQAQTKDKRGKLSRVLLEDVLAEQILKLNSFTYRGKTYEFNEGDAEEAIRRLKPSPIEQRGLVRTNQDIYDLLLLGTTIEKSIDGDKKSYSVKYVDWENPANNVYHVTAEMWVQRTGSTKKRRCDIVLFVNGIPFVVIENEAPSEDVMQGVSQLIGYQNTDEIPRLFHYAQLLIASNKNDVRYGTVGTSRKYYLSWREQEDKDEEIARLINTPLSNEQKYVLFTGDFARARPYFDELEAAGPRAVSEQDRVLYALCRPERLLELVRIFTVFDGGVRKIARYQQFFGVRETMRRLRQFEQDGSRRGGVIWHTQGSGKSLTMVMLGKALAFAKDIVNPRLVITTDRDDLDKQIKDTFKSCEMEPVRARTGTHLQELLAARTPLVTTIINKFEAAARSRQFVDDDPDIFVLVDESHRTQYGTFGAQMRRMLPRACYIGFTGTPLLKKEKSTLAKFGGLIHRYTIDEAVRDGAVVPLLYEGRYVEQNLTGTAIDTWFEKLARGLNPQQKADLKAKFSRMEMLAETEQAIYAKAMDISEHFRQTWQGTGHKAMLVAPSKSAAIRFKEILDDIGHVTSEVIISPPDEHEGNEEVDQVERDRVRQFWDAMMKKYRSENEYNRQIIEAFKGPNGPEILIVVSKLLTGFDAPRNTVLYVCKQLKEHNLLQAIARVNRLFEEGGKAKQFGYIIDYEGLLQELDGALAVYSSLDGFDKEDLVGVLTDVREELRRLPQLHQSVWDIFKQVPNKLDHEQLEQHLGDDDRREEFYARLRDFGRCLHGVLASEKAYEVFTDADLEKFKDDWKSLTKLRQSVQLRYQEVVAISEYEQKIAKLLDHHVIAEPAKVIVELVNLHDESSLKKVLKEADTTAASKADRIASATKRTITERMDEDPTLYKRFSDMLAETIAEYRAKRMSEKEYLAKVEQIARIVVTGQRQEGVPERIRDNLDAQALYGVLALMTARHLGESEASSEQAAVLAERLLDVIRPHLIVNVWQNEDAQKKLANDLDDFFFDVVKRDLGIELSINELDTVHRQILAIARARFGREA